MSKPPEGLLPIAFRIAGKAFALDLLPVTPLDASLSLTYKDAEEIEQPTVGDCGHSFGQGFYVYDEKLNKVFESENLKRYTELINKYSK